MRQASKNTETDLEFLYNGSKNITKRKTKKKFMKKRECDICNKSFTPNTKLDLLCNECNTDSDFFTIKRD